MSNRSKFHHLFAKKTKDINWFLTLKQKCQGETNHITVNPQFMAWTAPGNKIGVLDVNKPGKIGSDCGFIQAHDGPVVDVKFSPWDNKLLASTSDDGTCNLWKIPEEGVKKGNSITQKDSVTSLSGHEKKLGICMFHPTANNVLATCSMDKTIKLWDIEKGEEKSSLDIPNVPLHIDFNNTGNMMVCAARDKKLYYIDPRSSSPITQSAKVIDSIKGFRVVYCRDKDVCMVTGFDSGSSRMLKMFDPTAPEKPLSKKDLDLQSGVLMGFYDNDLGLFYAGGKGEGNIRYFDTANKMINSISGYQSNLPCLGLAMMPKLGLNTLDHEVGKFYKLCKDKIITLRVLFPRKIKKFQKDLFPKTPGFEPSNTAEDFFGGGDLNPPKLISLAPGERPEGFAEQKTTIVRKQAKKLQKKENLDLFSKDELAKLVLKLQEKLVKHEKLDTKYSYNV